jgi:uncharacterized protein YecE (DUF72 family)
MWTCSSPASIRSLTQASWGALLCQFPASFKLDDASIEYLTWLLKAFKEYPAAVELRHRSWSDYFGETLKLLNEHHAAFVQIAEPKFKTSIRQNQLPNITSGDADWRRQSDDTKHSPVTQDCRAWMGQLSGDAPHALVLDKGKRSRSEDRGGPARTHRRRELKRLHQNDA